MNWQAGDRAIVCHPGFALHGEVVELIGGPVTDGLSGYKWDWIIDPGYSAPDCTLRHWVCNSSDLRPINDGNEDMSWEDLQEILDWHPAKPITVEIEK